MNVTLKQHPAIECLRTFVLGFLIFGFAVWIMGVIGITLPEAFSAWVEEFIPSIIPPAVIGTFVLFSVCIKNRLPERELSEMRVGFLPLSWAFFLFSVLIYNKTHTIEYTNFFEIQMSLVLAACFLSSVFSCWYFKPARG